MRFWGNNKIIKTTLEMGPWTSEGLSGAVRDGSQNQDSFKMEFWRELILFIKKKETRLGGNLALNYRLRLREGDEIVREKFKKNKILFCSRGQALMNMLCVKSLEGLDR